MPPRIMRGILFFATVNQLKRKLCVIGIDEVGRGALAGPVTVAAFALVNAAHLHDSPHPPLRDSKQLTPSQREVWVHHIRAWKRKHPSDIFFAIESMPPRAVDRLNISEAANQAATKALDRVLARMGAHADIEVILDGGLHLRKEFIGLRRIRTLIKADERFDAVKLASIVAKVARDRKLISFHARYPRYHFPNHKGYGTKEHLNAIRAHGISPMHRLTFTRRFGTMKRT